MPSIEMNCELFLKSYILKQREKKKHEMELSIINEELERRKREEEMKRNRVKMTLEEIRSELSKLDQKLSVLKAEKHQLFSQLKKVLHEDDMRRRLRESELNQQLLQQAQQQQQHQQMVPQFQQFYQNSNLRPIYQKFSQHMIQHQNNNNNNNSNINNNQKQMNVQMQRPMKRSHDEQQTGGQLGHGAHSPPIIPQPQQTNYNYKNASVTYTPNIQKQQMDYNSYSLVNTNPGINPYSAVMFQQQQKHSLYQNFQ